MMLGMYNERYFRYDDGLDMTACDFHSVEAGLDEILERNHRLGYVDEDYTNLLNAAADLYDMLTRTVEQFSLQLPLKNIGYDERDTGIYWFNAAISLYNCTDMITLMDNEEKARTDEYKEKSLRLRAVNGLPKEQHFMLLTKTYGIVFRYIRLKTDLDVLIGVDDELERLHSAKKKNGDIILPKSAWV